MVQYREHQPKYMPAKDIKIKAGDDLKTSILEAINSLGGFGRFITRGDHVLVKPNFNTADPFPASSDPQFIAAFADLCHEHSAGRVAIGESCTYYLKTRKVMADWEMEKILESRPWLEAIAFDEGKWTKKKVPGAKYLKSVSVPKALGEFDRLFFLPCLKTHKYAKYTGALKLSVGLMRPRERMALHMSRLQEKIAELNTAVKPNLVVMDARKCFINKGPCAGTVRAPGLILAGTDRVALDIEGVTIIQEFEGNSLAGSEPRELPQIRRALELGVDRE